MFDEVLGQKFVQAMSVLGRHGGHAGGGCGRLLGRAGGCQLHRAVLRLLTVAELLQAAALQRLDAVHLISGLAVSDLRSKCGMESPLVTLMTRPHRVSLQTSRL